MNQCMGIDIYARWRGMTSAQAAAQITGFSIKAGNVGYLREAYHGEPYATRILVPEAFEADGHGAAIPAARMWARFPETLEAAEKRERTIYGTTDAEEIAEVLQSFREFIELCERKERETGEPCRIIASY
jgi:hypothetical protein